MSVSPGITVASTDEADLFRNYDRHFARMANLPPDWAAAERDPRRFASCKPWLPANRAARILDFGCGWGHQLLYLWCAEYRHLEGVEVSPEQVSVAERAAKGRIQLHCGDGLVFLSGKTSVYDLIVVNDVIEHIPPAMHAGLLKYIYNALAPGGRVVIRTPNMSNCLAAYSRYMDITHVTGFTEWSLMQLMDHGGFCDHRFVAEDLNWRPRTWRPWAPLRGLALRGIANLLVHRFLYTIRNQTPCPRHVGFNIELYSHKPKD
jgi:2-polyprenyl-3-methyl-5-hydroxy-6-metoxy-1,4-benzoquinol methylase